MNAPVKEQTQLTIKQYVSDTKVRQKFEEVLGKKTQGFLASVMQVANQSHLKNAVPATVVNAAMMAATLDLPINNNLGFAYIVPYSTDTKDTNGNKIPLLDENGNQVKKFFKNKEYPQWVKTVEAQFQLGYKGFIQLAQRSGQFSRIAAAPVFNGQLISANPLLGYEFDWSVPANGEAIGYVAFFKLLNGFTAELYMSKAEIHKHAEKYSQSFKYGGVWRDNFEAMALKTVTKLLLSKQAPLSIEMQTAQLADQSIVRDVETGEFDYIDHENEDTAAIEAPTQSLEQEQFSQLMTSISNGDLDKAFVLSGEAGYVLTPEQHQQIASM